MKNKLMKSLKEKKKIRLRTTHPDGDNYDGVVLHKTKEIIIFQEEYSFEFDGIHIFPLSFIKSIRDDKHDKCANDILKENGQFKKISKVNLFTKCVSIADCLNIIKKRNIWPAIEIVKGKASSLYVGPILEIDDTAVIIKCYDAAGKWEKNYTLKLVNIVRIEIKSKYLKHFNNYMKNL